MIIEEDDLKAEDVTVTVKELKRTKASSRKLSMGLDMDRSQLVQSLPPLKERRQICLISGQTVAVDFLG